MREVEAGTPKLWFCVTCDQFYPVGTPCDHVDVTLRSPWQDVARWLRGLARRDAPDYHLRFQKELKEDRRRDR